jgi:hypothetical protein
VGLEAEPLVEIRRIDKPGRTTVRVRAAMPATGVRLNPPATGVRVELRRASGALLGTLEAPAGAGWRVNRARTRWTYGAPRGSAGYVARASVRYSPNGAGIEIDLRARGIAYAMTASDVPLGLRVAVSDPWSEQCGELRFEPEGAASPACRFDARRTSVICR